MEMAYQFFELNKSSFPIANPREDLKPTYKSFNKTSGVISFQEMYHGVPVQYADIIVRFTPSGELRGIEGEYHYDINLSSTPSIDSTSAERIALKDVGTSDTTTKLVNNREYFTHLEICTMNDKKLHLIWFVWIHQENPPHSWRYQINAQDGTILGKSDIIERN